MNEIRFDKYRLLERISHGGMAEVFRAKTFGAAGFEREVAIKLLLPNVAMDRDFITMLIDEAKIAGQLSHANIAQIFDLGSAEGRYYIVQEYVHGRDLRNIIRKCRSDSQTLGVAHACHIMLKVCEGLDYAHNKRDVNGQPLNVVHRDVSPQNVLVSMDGEIKLIDFGIAKAEGRATRTLAGLVKGKFAYMSPEQIRGLPVNRRSDVFACGIVFHELLTTQPLFLRKSEFETLKRARSGDIPPPSTINPEVPVELDGIALKALARHVDDRFQSAQEMREALWDFVKNSGTFFSQGKLAGWMRSTFRIVDENTQTQNADTTERDRKSKERIPRGQSQPTLGIKPGQLTGKPDLARSEALTPAVPEVSFGQGASKTEPDGARSIRGDFANVEETTDVDSAKKRSFNRVDTSPRYSGPGRAASGPELLPDDPGRLSVSADGAADDVDTTQKRAAARAAVDPAAALLGEEIVTATPGDSTSIPTNRALSPEHLRPLLPQRAIPSQPDVATPATAAYQGRTSRHSMRALEGQEQEAQKQQAEPKSRRRTNLLVAAAIFLLLVAGATSLTLALLRNSDDAANSSK